MAYLLLLTMIYFDMIDGRTEPVDVTSNHFRAAKYSLQIDFSRIRDIVPEAPMTMQSYQYYIEYGENTVIYISDPGSEVSYLPVLVMRWDYAENKYQSEIILNHVRKYYLSTDSIPFSIEDSRGVVQNLCHDGIHLSKCDSLLFTRETSTGVFLVHVHDSITNIRAPELYYPDIQYLPTQIIRKDKRQATRTLEAIFYGQQAVDSLLQLFNHDGYERITDAEMDSYELQMSDEMIENLEKMLKD